ncbi:MAG: energy transducer TonB [Colwellia sp.]|nr:energy transducer TonB [Colwellia sp.]
MSSPLTDKEISELYQQRKNQISAPSINIDALIRPKVKKKSFSQKFFVVLSISSFASFSILALINQLRQPVEVHSQKSEISLQREVKLVAITNDEKSPLALPPLIEKIPALAQAANKPKVGNTTALTHIEAMPSAANLINQINNQNIEINTQISTDTLNLVLIKKVQPKYPVKAQQLKLQGLVKLSYQVNSLGNVINITVEKTTNKAFTKSALKALNQWKYQRNNKVAQDELPQHKIEFTFNID